MWKYPGRIIHIIALSLISAWITSRIINRVLPKSIYISPSNEISLEYINRKINLKNSYAIIDLNILRNISKYI